MKKLLFILILTFQSGALFASSAATGKITEIQVAVDHDNIYFKLDTMPSGVSQWFFLSPKETGAHLECSYNSNLERMKRAYSALLTAKAQGKSITIGYCKASNGYGLINTFFRVNP